MQRTNTKSDNMIAQARQDIEFVPLESAYWHQFGSLLTISPFRRRWPQIREVIHSGPSTRDSEVFLRVRLCGDQGHPYSSWVPGADSFLRLHGNRPVRTYTEHFFCCFVFDAIPSLRSTWWFCWEQAFIHIIRPSLSFRSQLLRLPVWYWQVFRRR